MTVAADLPSSGLKDLRAREKNDLDFKGYANKSALWEHAIDLAAFANRLGGVILVGVTEIKGKDEIDCHGLKQSFSDVQATYEKAGAEFCSPPLPVSVVRLAREDGVAFAAVHVDATTGIVGARAGIMNRNSDPIVHEHGWTFPLRTGGRNAFLRPAELPMYMNVATRRNLLLLEAIPPGERRQVQVIAASPVGYGPPYQTTATVFALREVDLQTNAVRLVYAPGGMESSLTVPLTEIVDLWRAENGWVIRVRGIITRTPSSNHIEAFTFSPLPPSGVSW